MEEWGNFLSILSVPQNFFTISSPGFIVFSNSVQQLFQWVICLLTSLKTVHVLCMFVIYGKHTLSELTWEVQGQCNSGNMIGNSSHGQ